MTPHTPPAPNVAMPAVKPSVPIFTCDGAGKEAKRAALTDLFLKVLNEAYAADPGAIHALVCNRIPCNQALADHPTIQVQINPVLPGELPTVGMMGVINGLVETATGERIATKWEQEGGKVGRFLGFTRYTP